jgi:NTE family protein
MTPQAWGAGLLLLAELCFPSHAAVFEAVYEYDGANPPRQMALPVRPQLALVLGGGGRRGFAHAGALRALEAGGVKPDLIVGVSIGAIMGALYAGGTSAIELERLAREFDLASLRDLSWLHWGQVRGQKLQDFVNARLGQRPLEALPIRLAVVAARKRDRTPGIFNAGDAGAAVRASSAVPDRFYAVRIAGETYVDGDLASPVPVRAARMLGARVVVAVDISAYTNNTPDVVPDSWRHADQERRKRIDAETGLADVVIHPDIGYFAGTSSSYRERVILAAARAVEAALPAIRAALLSTKSATSATPARAPVPKTSPAPPAGK